jgi:hypothetical protein
MIPSRTIFIAAAFLLIATAAYSQPAGSDESLTIETDESLTVEQYLGLGVPPPDRAWQAEDYKKAGRVFSKLSREQLPRFESPRSGEIFARIVSLDNFDRPEGITQLDLEGHDVMSSQMMRLANTAMDVSLLALQYIDPMVGLQPYSAEIARLTLYSLQLTRATRELVEWFPKPDREDREAVEERIEQQTRLGKTLYTMAFGIVGSLQGDDYLDPDDQIYLADGLRFEGRQVFKFLNKSQKKDLRALIQKVLAEHSNTDVRTALKSLLAETKK